MLVMASLGLPSSIFHFQGLGFSLRKTLTTDRCLRMNSLSKESSILDHTNNHSDHQNGKPWTTPNTNIHGEEQRLPPLIAAMKSAMEENPATFQFPGHNRGFAAPSSLTQLIGEWPFLYDVGELDDLFTPEGPILEAQRTAAEVFGASETWFLVGGTTCGVLAAIMGTCSPGDVLILPRNCHISAISALALCGAIPKYVFPDYDSCWDAPTLVSPLEVEKAIKEVLASDGKKPAAVFITSPTYHGICSNVKEISTLCHFHGIPLIVDEAHGAHFGFHPQLPISALQQGADLVIQSTHKVLLSLTQSSMLHKSHTSLVNTQKISKCLQILQSTSPSFLLLASLDATTSQLKHNPKVIFDNAIHLSIEAKNALQQIPGVSVLDLPNSDPLRVTVGVHNLGISGYEARNFLYKDQRLLPVLTSSRAITFLFTPGTCREHVDRLVNGFKHLSVSSSNLHNYVKKNSVHRLELKPFMDIDMRFSPREAFFAKKKKVNVNDCVGKVCGELICPYPPGIPVMIPGEVISEKGLSMLLQAKAHGAKITGASNPLLTTIVVCDDV